LAVLATGTHADHVAGNDMNDDREEAPRRAARAITRITPRELQKNG